MAVYKVPQDVEADDKLIGPFSFRQFIYLIIVALSGFAAWGLSQLFIPLAILPLPIILLFGALALPLRKDQPMEIYMAAMVSFFLKPHKRLWDADGTESLIEITVPKIIEIQRTKNISQSDAEQRFGYLAELVDSQGWAVRGMGVQAPNSAMNSDAYFAAQQTEDVLDTNNSVAQALNYKLDQTDAKRHQEVVNRIHTQAQAGISTQLPPQQSNIYTTVIQQGVIGDANSQPVSIPGPRTTLQNSITLPAAGPTPIFNPYPVSIQQSTIQPISNNKVHAPAAAPTTEPYIEPHVATSEKHISPDIMNLASNTDLSIETIAHEANRIHEKENMNDEVIIKLR